MTRSERRRPAWRLAATLLTTMLLVAACGAQQTASEEPSTAAGSEPAESAAAEQITLTVVSLRPGSEPEAFEAFEEQVAQFEEANPDIDVVSEEYEWTGPTFAAQLAGGTLPDVFTIPFTDGKSLIEQGQLADISEHVAALPYADQFNPNVLDAGPGRGRQHLRHPDCRLRHRSPLQPGAVRAGGPRSRPAARRRWDEVREYAKAIADETGQAGYVQMSQSNTGGWQLTTLSYALGGRVQEGAGADAVVDHRQRRHARRPRPPARDALDRQLDGQQLPLRLGHDQPGLRGRA